MSQPIWVHGRVPNGYWNTRDNRLRYMRWLGRRLGYRKPEHWYGLSRQKFMDNYGGGLLATAYQHSPLHALHDFMPDYDWKPWLLSSTPQSYWRNRANRRRFMTWLGEQLGFQTNEDWYQLTQRHFRDHGGNGLLAIYYHNSPLQALKDFKPRVKWREWEFAATPQGYWHEPENRRRYMNWLGQRLGFRKPDHWYRLTRRHFYNNHGAAFLRSCPRTSPVEAVKEHWPDHDWKEWLFPRVPNGFWDDRGNRQRYLRWLGQQLGFTRLRDWYRLTREDVRQTGGGAMLSLHYHNSLHQLLHDLMPDHDWDADLLYNPDPDKKLKNPPRKTKKKTPKKNRRTPGKPTAARDKRLAA